MTILGIKYFVFLLILSNIQYNLEKAGNDEEVEEDDGFTVTKKTDEYEADQVGGNKFIVNALHSGLVEHSLSL